MSLREGRPSARVLTGGVLWVLAATLLLASCRRSGSEGDPREKRAPSSWSQILISFQGALNSRSDRPREEAQKLAKELLHRIQRGSSFDRLARTYSDHPSGLRSGRLPGKESPAPQIDRVVERLEAGQVGPAVIETAEGFHVVRRDE